MPDPVVQDGGGAQQRGERDREKNGTGDPAREGQSMDEVLATEPGQH